MFKCEPYIFSPKNVQSLYQLFTSQSLSLVTVSADDLQASIIHHVPYDIKNDEYEEKGSEKETKKVVGT